MTAMFLSEQFMLSVEEDLIKRVKTGVPWLYRSWEPDGWMVVLGRSNLVATEVYAERCREDQIPIVRRRGGGGTVMLAPGMLVIALCKTVAQRYQFQHYFSQINMLLIESLRSLGIQHLRQQGYSDICLNDRKILGSSMYRSHYLLYYTASLMVANDLDGIARYLKHPSKEPAYRQGRSHQEFLTTINREYPHITVDAVKTRFDALIPHRIPEIL